MPDTTGSAESVRRGKSDVLSVRVHPELIADLRALAEEQQSSMGYIVREACAKLLRHSKAVKKAKTVGLPPPDPEHVHPVDSSIPYERAQQILARHLCGWIAGHHALPEHFLVDADMILGEMHAAGVRFHLRGVTENSLDGFVSTLIDGSGSSPSIGADQPEKSREICPECLRPVGEVRFGAPCTPVDCDYRAALIDGDDDAD